MAEDAAAVSAGTLDPDEAKRRALTRFETVLLAVDRHSDEDVLEAVMVDELNQIHREHSTPDKATCSYETGEREQLCPYLEQSLAEIGVDVEAVAERRGLDRHDITDEWREW